MSNPGPGAGETREQTDADRLRYIAENPSVLPFLHDLFGERTLKAGADPLAAIRSVLDDQMWIWPTGTLDAESSDVR